MPKHEERVDDVERCWFEGVQKVRVADFSEMNVGEGREPLPRLLDHRGADVDRPKLLDVRSEETLDPSNPASETESGGLAAGVLPHALCVPFARPLEIVPLDKVRTASCALAL